VSVYVSSFAVGVLCEATHSVAGGRGTPQLPLCREESLYAHRAARVDATSGDADLSAETKSRVE
jgi:hypothetical protein